MRARPKVRGAVSTVTGWFLVFWGSVFAFAAFGASFLFISNIQATWLPGPPLAVTYDFALLGVSAAIAGGGVLLIGFGRQERDREEKFLLDPLSYPPFRHPWRRVLPWLALVVLVLVLPSLWILPVAHSFQTEFPVSYCTPGNGGAVHNVDLPSGAILTYQWSSWNGRPVGEVWAPSGPRLNATQSVSDAFFNSTYGWSAVQSNGSAIPFWACDFVGTPTPPPMIVISGTYYVAIL